MELAVIIDLKQFPADAAGSLAGSAGWDNSPKVHRNRINDV
jgi:hypothetical protein